MDVNRTDKTRQLVAHGRPGLLLAAAGAVLLALWLAWTGWQQMQDGTRRDSLAITRDAVAQSAARSLGAELSAEGTHGLAPVRGAGRGDLDAAARRWRDAEPGHAAVLETAWPRPTRPPPKPAMAASPWPRPRSAKTSR